MSRAAPAACTRRKATSIPTLVEAAQAAEAAVKTATPNRKPWSRRCRSAIRPKKHEQGGVDDGVAVEDPGQVGHVGGPEVPGDVRQGHVHDEQVQAGQDDPGAHDGQHPAGVSTRGRDVVPGPRSV